MWVERGGRRGARLELHSLTVSRSSELWEGPGPPGDPAACMDSPASLPWGRPQTVMAKEAQRGERGEGEGEAHPDREGFLLEVVPGLRSDCKKNYCSPVNSGSSSHTQRSAEPAQLPKITEEETEAGRHGAGPDCSAPSPPDCGSASTEQVHTGLHEVGKWAPGVFLGRPRRRHPAAGLDVGVPTAPLPTPAPPGDRGRSLSPAACVGRRWRRAQAGAAVSPQSLPGQVGQVRVMEQGLGCPGT